MSDLGLFKEAKEAIEEGDYDRARDLLTRLLRIEQNNPEYWLWMSTVVYSLKEKIYCLKNVIKLDPENSSAKRGLVLLGAVPEDGVEPSVIRKRDWEVLLGSEETFGWHKLIPTPIARIGLFVLIGFIMIGLLLSNALGVPGIWKHELTITPIPWTQTPSYTVTNTQLRPTTMLRLTSTPKPLWMLLEATYTPTLIYVNTPHPRTEAYRLAIRAWGKGNYEEMIYFLKQVLEEEPEAVDVLYYLGEAYLGLGDHETALKYYEDALLVNPQFAPAYLSRARLKQTTTPYLDILNDLTSAINCDPTYAEAYYDRAIYWFMKKDYESALIDLEIAKDLMPFEARISLELAKVNLALGNNETALENALSAYQMDITFLETYLVLGKSYLVNDMPEEGLSTIETYGLYFPEDPYYLALLGGAFYEIGKDFEYARIILEQAKALNNDLVEAYYYHGLVSYELGDTNQAVNDLYIARNLMPENLEYSLWFGVLLYEDGRYPEAYSQLDLINPTHLNAKQAGRYYYYRAKTGIALSLIEPVKAAWMALLELPHGSVPDAWINEAEDYLWPPTETLTPTQTASVAITTSPIPSPTVTATTSISLTPVDIPESTKKP